MARLGMKWIAVLAPVALFAWMTLGPIPFRGQNGAAGALAIGILALTLALILVAVFGRRLPGGRLRPATFTCYLAGLLLVGTPYAAAAFGSPLGHEAIEALAFILGTLLMLIGTLLLIADDRRHRNLKDKTL